MQVQPQKKRADTHLPHELSAMLAALGNATAAFVDETATYACEEEMYAVFDTHELTTAYTYLVVAFSRYASHLSMQAVEEPRRILLCVRGNRRIKGTPVSSTALLPERAECRAELLRILQEGGMAFDLRAEADALTLVIALPRFLTDHYDVCTVKNKEICEALLNALCRLAGVGRRSRKIAWNDDFCQKGNLK